MCQALCWRTSCKDKENDGPTSQHSRVELGNKAPKKKKLKFRKVTLPLSVCFLWASPGFRPRLSEF